MAKRNARQLNSVYKRPIPLAVMALPELVPHNPVLWVYFAYKLCYYLSVFSPHLPVVRVELDDTVTPAIFKVSDRDAMLHLWRNGFFGKGLLSRSEPTWGDRVTQGTSPALEAVTSARRQERQVFKDHRARLQQLETKGRLQPLTEDEETELTKLRQLVDDLRKQEGKVKLPTPPPVAVAKSPDLEYLQLQAVEALFLLYVGAIAIAPTTRLPLLEAEAMAELAVGATRTNPATLQYVAYHYFRSLGWCVRSGIKFGTDFLLYKRGPVFGHAEHAVVVMDAEKPYNWHDLATVSRVIGTVNKNLVLVYVVAPPADQFAPYTSVEALVAAYKVSHVVYRRWNPSRTRD